MVAGARDPAEIGLELATISLVKKQANGSNHLDGEALTSVKPGFKKARTKHFQSDDHWHGEATVRSLSGPG